MANIVGGGDKGKSIRIEVVQQIKDLVTTTSVRAQLVKDIAEADVKKSAGLLAICMEHIKKLERDLDKIRPDVVTYNRDGSKKSEDWSKPKLDEIGKLEQKIKKGKDAFEKYFTDGDITDVVNWNNSQSQPSGKDKGGSGGESPGTADT